MLYTSRSSLPAILAVCSLAALAAPLAAQRLTADFSSTPTAAGSHNSGYIDMAWNRSLASRLSASYTPSTKNEMESADGFFIANQASVTAVNLDALAWTPGNLPFAFSLGAAWYGDALDEKGTFTDGESFTISGHLYNVTVLFRNIQRMDTFGPRLKAGFSPRRLFGLPIDLDASIGAIPIYFYTYSKRERLDFLVIQDAANPANPVIPPISADYPKSRIGSPIVFTGLGLRLFSYVSIGADYLYKNMTFDFLNLNDDYSGFSPETAHYNSHELGLRAFLEVPVVEGAVLKLGVERKQTWDINLDLYGDGDPATDPIRSDLTEYRILFGFSLR